MALMTVGAGAQMAAVLAALVQGNNITANPQLVNDLVSADTREQTHTKKASSKN